MNHSEYVSKNDGGCDALSTVVSRGERRLNGEELSVGENVCRRCQ